MGPLYQLCCATGQTLDTPMESVQPPSSFPLLSIPGPPPQTVQTDREPLLDGVDTEAVAGCGEE